MAPRIQDQFARTSYEGIEFPSLDITTDWGHDSVRHQGLLTPGSDTETTGRKPLEIKLRIAFLNDIQNWFDNLYPDVYEQLMQKFQHSPFGTLVHPTKGQIVVHVDSISEHIDAKIGNGFFVDVQFSEKSLPDEVFSGQSDAVNFNLSQPQDAATTSAQSADLAGDAMLGGLPAGAVRVLVIIQTLLNLIDAGNVALSSVRSAFSTAINSIRSNISIAVGLGVAGHDWRVPLEASLAATYRYQELYISAKKPTYYRVPVTMSLARIAAQPSVYGDSSKANYLLLANKIQDPMNVSQGTILTVLPII